MGSSRLDPLAVKSCWVEAVPLVVEKGVRVALTVIAGPASASGKETGRSSISANPTKGQNPVLLGGGLEEYQEVSGE